MFKLVFLELLFVHVALSWHKERDNVKQMENPPLFSKNFKPKYWTCDPRSNSSSLKFCDSSLTFEERVKNLTGYIDNDMKISHFVFNMGAVEDIYVKGYYWDATCIQGVDWPSHGSINVTVFPNAIAQGATFDRSLVAKAGNATAFELRAMRHPTDGAIPGVCDGGPLANTAHDPRWGRNSETYGEDPFLSSRLGVTALKALQSKTNFNGTDFLLVPQVTRHYLGFHGARPDCDGTMYVDQRNLEDAYFPVYEAYQVEGEAEGIMCSYAVVDGVPSCANKQLLETKLRKEWNSDAFIQSDCCDSVSSIADSGYVENDYEALKIAVDTGLQLLYGYKRKDYAKYFAQALENGDLAQKQLDDAINRLFLTRFRTGEFDDIPWNHLPDGIIESAYHRSVAREIASASVVLLKNDNNLLPLQLNKYTKIAVIGPFAHCTQISHGGGYGSRNCYFHNYAGASSNVTTIYDAFMEASIDMEFSVQYAPGVNATGNVNNSYLQEAQKLAEDSDLVILCLGLGSDIEQESRDRTFLGLPDSQIALLETIVNTKKPMVIPLVSAGGIDLPYDDLQNAAILQIWYPGQEAGYAVTDVAFGKVVPSGRLSVTIYKNETLALIPNITNFNIDEGVGRTYRYLKNKTDLQLYGFGFGLSYTTFIYSKLSLTFQDSSISISFSVTNTGNFDAHEVYQIYVQNPPNSETIVPNHSLKEFDRIFLKQKETQNIQVKINKNDLATVLRDGSKGKVTGNYVISVGGFQPDEWRDGTSNVIQDSINL